MDLAELRATLDQPEPPKGIAPHVRALWFAAKGDWDQAHEIAQAQNDAAGSWVHAHLHRVEGDLGNAGYWYRRAGQPVCTDSLEDEWAAMTATLLAEPR